MCESERCCSILFLLVHVLSASRDVRCICWFLLLALLLFGVLEGRFGSVLSSSVIVLSSLYWHFDVVILPSSIKLTRDMVCVESQS
jgi:hypothetical protein